MSEPVNLNRFRKEKVRAQRKARAEQNVAKFGRSRAEKNLDKLRDEKARRDLDGHKTEE